MDYPFSPAELKQNFWGANQGDKSTLRKSILAHRKQMHPRAAAYKSSLINQQLNQSPFVYNAKTIACYQSIQNEVDLELFINECLINHKRLLFPKVQNQDIQFYHVIDIQNQMLPGEYSILEPDPSKCALVSPEEIDLYIVPGIAFDLFGCRVGYGGGYYDRYLSQKRQDAVTIGVGYDFQLTNSIESSEHDIPLDVVITNSTQDDKQISPMMKQWSTHSPEETQGFAIKLIEYGLSQHSVIALHGGLGTGKTEFVKGLAKACEIDQHVASPTYVFIHEYTGRQPFRHIDSYRIDSLKAADEEFWNEALVKDDGFVVIEWAEKIGNLLPYDTVHIVGRYGDNNLRDWCMFTPFQHQKHLHEIIAC